MKGVKKRRRYSRVPVCEIRPGFTDLMAAIEEAEYLHEESSGTQHYAVVQSGPILRVVQHRSDRRQVWSTLGAKCMAEWRENRGSESLLQQKPENL